MSRLRLALAVALALVAGRTLAFHEGGAASCEGCHSMHGTPSGREAGAGLLAGSDPSSTCLQCHGGTTRGTYQVFTSNIGPGVVPQQLTPGGDFAWLQRSFLWPDAKGGTVTSPGERHGHSVVANDWGFSADSTNRTAPGGFYPADQLTCISCHDPHGGFRQLADGTVSSTGSPILASGSYGGAALVQPGAGFSVGVYRLLGGAGYKPRSFTVQPFSAPPPVALSPASYNRSERDADTRVAYGAGMSEWCQNCHTNIHVTSSQAAAAFKHPAGATARLATGGELNIYNQYIRTGVLTGVQSTSYTSMVPYEEGTTSRPVLAPRAVSDGSQTSGPTTGGENVMCLSCHRAHASGWDHALRWNMPASGTIVFGGAWPGIDGVGDARLPANAQGRLQAETQAAMYDRNSASYAAYQKTLCNKCHGQD